jgi:hypothetical protein
VGCCVFVHPSQSVLLAAKSNTDITKRFIAKEGATKTNGMTFMVLGDPVSDIVFGFIGTALMYTVKEYCVRYLGLAMGGARGEELVAACARGWTSSFHSNRTDSKITVNLVYDVGYARSEEDELWFDDVLFRECDGFVFVFNVGLESSVAQFRKARKRIGLIKGL